MFPNGYMPYSPYGALNMAGSIPRSGGLLSRLGLKSINWGNLLTNTSKTLNVINQAIPVVKQVGPMFNNMKSVLKVASLFSDATNGNDNSKVNNSTTDDNSINSANNNISANNNNNVTNNITNNDSNSNIDKEVNEKEINTNYINNSPNFFI